MPIYRRKPKNKLCRSPGCNRLVRGGSEFCRAHQPHKTSKEAAESKKFLNSSAWLNLRKAKIEETPWCEQCEAEGRYGVPAKEIDHIKPRHLFPKLKLTYSNLMSLCKRCHGRKTQAETRSS